MADQDLVKGILVNLLENAAEAAGEGGRILARCSRSDDRVAIEVHDSGPGLSDLARKSLFQPTISFKKRGMGLGLSIARKSALLTGGDILLIAGELAARVSASSALSFPKHHRMNHASARILVVDDEENIGRSLRMILEREGYQVNAVHSPPECALSPSAPA
jgi:K+-sensing histidine kinase KdpD